ncbi:hypothetical protein [Cellulosilyticum ruminicola]|nr:hypothetical protein [Cellulosilyticum ruminicola]
MLTGYMPDYSGTMWIGYSDPKPLTKEGKDYEVNIWANIMSQVCDK